MFLSGVTNTSNPASSAALSKSPFLSLCHPRCQAASTVCPLRNGRIGTGVIGRRGPALAGNRRRWSDVKAAGGKLDDGFDLFAVQTFEPLHNVVNVGAGFQIFKDDGNGHARPLEHPRAAYLSRDAFHRRAL